MFVLCSLQFGLGMVDACLCERLRGRGSVTFYGLQPPVIRLAFFFFCLQARGWEAFVEFALL